MAFYHAHRCQKILQHWSMEFHGAMLTNGLLVVWSGSSKLSNFDCFYDSRSTVTCDCKPGKFALSSCKVSAFRRTSAFSFSTNLTSHPNHWLGSLSNLDNTDLEQKRSSDVRARICDLVPPMLLKCPSARQLTRYLGTCLSRKTLTRKVRSRKPLSNLSCSK